MFIRVVSLALCSAALATVVAAQELKPATPAAASAQETAAPKADSEKGNDIRRLLEVTGSSRLGAQVIDQLFGSFRQNRADVPESFWDELRREMNVNELTELVVPIYDRHLTHDDVKQLIAFYDSPVGRKLLSVQPQILAESMQIGQEWGRAAAERVVKRLSEKGYGPKPS